MKSFYEKPQVEVSMIIAEALICASGNNEDFGKGDGFSFDLFEGVKPF